jgi:general secretion pathway protein B
MSLILDALKKSERTRQQSLTAQLGSGEVPGGSSRLPVPWVTLIGVMLVANALLLFFFWPRAAPVPVPAPLVSAPAPQAYRPSVRPLAQETDDVVTPQAPAQTGASVPPASPQPSSVHTAPITLPAALPPAMDSLPDELRQSLPVLHMDVHGYAGNPQDRFVVINLKQYHIGDSVADGVVLKDIVPQGAVLEYRGSTFLLPAS